VGLIPRREAFVEELVAAVVVYPLTIDVARLAGKLDSEQQSRGIVIPFADLLIGYDLVVTVANDPGFEYQIAGHVENGEDSISDPAMGGLI
jgi:predicted nucleic acid-binding protein